MIADALHSRRYARRSRNKRYYALTEKPVSPSPFTSGIKIMASTSAPDFSWLNITTNLHHDVYPAVSSARHRHMILLILQFPAQIDPQGTLKNSCRGQSVLITGAVRGIGRVRAILSLRRGHVSVQPVRVPVRPSLLRSPMQEP